jgi:CcmD family protein
MEPNPMNYLFAAYVAIWLILAVYMFSIQSRQKKLQGEIEQLKHDIPDKSTPAR